MVKKRFIWVLILAALVLSGSALMAQAPAGPEKVMIYNGEQLKVQLTGMLRLDMMLTEYNTYGNWQPLWVKNQKFGVVQGGYYTVPQPYSSQGIKALVFLPWQAELRRGVLKFNANAAQIGVTIVGPGVLGGTTFGRFEMDFSGGFAQPAGNISRQPVLRLRNAYAGIRWDKELFSVSFTFGQYTSLLLPAYAYPVSLHGLPFFEKGVLFDWSQGFMLGFRIGPRTVNVSIDVAMVRVKAGNDNTSTLFPGDGPNQPDGSGPGEASKRPGWEGRILLTVAPVPIFRMYLGVQGHYYAERQHILHANFANYGLGAWSPLLIDAADVPSKSLGLQANIVVWIFSLRGAGWMGENMDNFAAMFGTGYYESQSGKKNLAAKGRGGYAQLVVNLPAVGVPLSLWVGMGQETKNHTRRMPNATTLGIPVPPYNLPQITSYAVSAAGVLWNSEVQGGIKWLINNYLNLGLEISQMVTKYKGVPGTSTSMTYRVQTNFIF